MMPRPSLNDHDLQRWFNYFRMTAYVPAMTEKFRHALREAPTPESARTILTAYTACAINLHLGFNLFSLRDNFLPSLYLMNRVSPASFLSLDLNAIAALAEKSGSELIAHMKSLGFTVDKTGIVTATPSLSTGKKTEKPPSPR